jgi:glucan endo-1,3-alpha-glucosidase
MSSITQAIADVSQAQSLGLDAFALNVQQPDAEWTQASLSLLFEAAAQIGFKVFFSMDMAVIPSPSAFVPLFKAYASHPAYYRYRNRPFLSTFRGGAHPDWQAALQSLTPTPYFIPNFEDHPSVQAGAFPPSIFTTLPYLGGLMGWETAWPFPGSNTTGTSSLDTTDAANLAVCHAQHKTYMLPLSTHQFKHHPQHGNWLRPGGLNLPQHMLLALRLQPDFVQLLTWNDAGEGHYFGNIWPEALPDADMRAVVDGWDHRGWQAVIRPFVAALRKGVSGAEGVVPVPVPGADDEDGQRGKGFAGAFWYRPLLKGADCGVDRLGLGKPDGWEWVEDKVSVVVVLGRESQGVKVRVWSGGQMVGEFEGLPGMNVYQVEVGKGEQVVQVVAGDGRVVGEGRGAVGVTDRIEDLGGICNYNYQVVDIV